MEEPAAAAAAGAAAAPVDGTRCTGPVLRFHPMGRCKLAARSNLGFGAAAAADAAAFTAPAIGEPEGMEAAKDLRPSAGGDPAGAALPPAARRLRASRENKTLPAVAVLDSGSESAAGRAAAAAAARPFDAAVAAAACFLAAALTGPRFCEEAAAAAGRAARPAAAAVDDAAAGTAAEVVWYAALENSVCGSASPSFLTGEDAPLLGECECAWAAAAAAIFSGLN